MTPNNTYPVIEADGLKRCFGRHVVVHEVNLKLGCGDVLGFLGPNGAGKSTTMRMLTGNLAPDSGSVRICGVDLLKNPLEAKRYIGYLPEIPPLYKELTVDEYLQFAARLHGLANTSVQIALDEVKQQCELSDVGKRLIGILSKGYQQRVAIAQAIIHRPQLIIMDEPTVGLDPNQIQKVRALIRELGKTHAIILSSHILSEVESVCNRVQIMHQGRLVLDDNLDNLKQRNMNLENIFTQLTAENAPAWEWAQ
ncbi:ABC transporter ATP-binding protein [Nitrosomonas eutropha]|uniref:ABC-2 type transport system ATP-binding protein n=2 Tax=Nitrosomonas eutropha TaxID=916 RepID=A0ABX5M8T1_9PROT|nr:ABC transporter ATP-binding protein [Nitrosomonas eutropha]ABI60713.1 ABC transporter-related protein [Nitrosomonas eutropha C91]PXV79434.1 ABC-2 type transport system ATP-binding protein [Nitrosomonas eutropha]SEI48213.1 ABC-2 type transport system ATP-binding protein [Nitrosomonas eutropha]